MSVGQSVSRKWAVGDNSSDIGGRAREVRPPHPSEEARRDETPGVIWSFAGSSRVRCWSQRRPACLAIATEAVAGREGRIPVALTGGVPPLLAFQYSVSQDLAWAFLICPVFLRWIHRSRDRANVFARRLCRIEDSAREHEAYVERWGPVGVFLFMLLPFLVNGPLVGLVLGRLGGIPTRHLLLSVLGVTAVASGAWTFLYDRMFALTDVFDPRLGRWIAMGVVAVVLALGLVDVVRDRGKWRTE